MALLKEGRDETNRRSVGAGTGSRTTARTLKVGTCGRSGDSVELPKPSFILDSHGPQRASADHSSVLGWKQQQQQQKVWKPLCKWFLLEAESHPPPIRMGALQRDSGPAAGRERLLFSPSVKSARLLLLIITTSYFAFKSFVSFYGSVHLPFHLLHLHTGVHGYRE